MSKDKQEEILLKAMKDEYPEILEEFDKLQAQQRLIFMSKMLDYGRGNITQGGDMKKDEDVKYSMIGLSIRMNDKLSRIKNLLSKNKAFVSDETIEDTLLDLSNYGLIGVIVNRKKW